MVPRRISCFSFCFVVPAARQQWSRKVKEVVIEESRTVGLAEAAHNHDVPFHTAQHFAKQLEQSVPPGHLRASGAGRKTALDANVEDVLAQFIRHRRAAYAFFGEHDVKEEALALFSEFGEEGKFVASSGWLKDFLHTHSLASHSSHSLQKVRRGDANLLSDDQRVQMFWHQIRFLREHKGFSLDQIVNCDETHVSYEMHPSHVIDERGGKGPVKVLSEGKEKAACTVLLCTTASGRKLPPLVIFKGERQLKVEHDENKLIVLFNRKGFMNEHVYSLWIEKYLAAAFPNGCLLVHDAFRGHFTQKAELTALKHKVLFVCVPEALTSRVQPMDVSVNGPFKKQLAIRCAHFLSLREKMDITDPLRAQDWRQVVVGWIVAAFESVKEQTIVKSFQITGISNDVSGAQDQLVTVELDHKRVVPKPYQKGSDAAAEKDVKHELISDIEVLKKIKEYKKERAAKKKEKEEKKAEKEQKKKEKEEKNAQRKKKREQKKEAHDQEEKNAETEKKKETKKAKRKSKRKSKADDEDYTESSDEEKDDAEDEDKEAKAERKHRTTVPKGSIFRSSLDEDDDDQTPEETKQKSTRTAAVSKAQKHTAPASAKRSSKHKHSESDGITTDEPSSKEQKGEPIGGHALRPSQAEQCPFYPESCDDATKFKTTFARKKHIENQHPE